MRLDDMYVPRRYLLRHQNRNIPRLSSLDPIGISTRQLSSSWPALMQPADKVGWRDDAASIDQLSATCIQNPIHFPLDRFFCFLQQYLEDRNWSSLPNLHEVMASPQQIVIEPMTQQLLVQNAGEDWTGVTSTAERRKLQNRLNKRSQCE